MFANMRSVVAFEYKNAVFRKSFIISLLIIAGLILLVSFLPNIIGMLQRDDDGIAFGTAVFADSSGFVTIESISEGLPFYQWTQAQPHELSGIIEAGDAQFAVYFSAVDAFEIFVSDTNIAPHPVVFVDFMRVNFQTSALQGFGLGEAEINRIVGLDIGHSWRIVELEDPDAAIAHDPVAGAVSTALVIIIFLTVVTSSSMISAGIVSEKTTKTIELLFISAKPTAIVTGKIIASLLVTLTTYAGIALAGVLIFAGPTLLSNAFDGNFQNPLVALLLEEGISFGISAAQITFMILFMLCAIIAFSYLYAGFAATVRDAQEGAPLMAIPQMILMGAYFGSLILGQIPGIDHVLNALTYIPLISPIFMIRYMTVSDPSTTHILIVLGLNLLYVAFFAYISSKIYSMCIMFFGHKITFKFIIDRMRGKA